MNDCNDISKKLIPLSRAVKAALIDTYSDAGRSTELYYHWAARVFKKLNRESLKMGKRHVLLPVNHNTKTAALPADFETETFVGVIINGCRVPMPLNNKLINTASVEEVECDNTCKKCKQNKSICEDLEISETTETLKINGTDYPVTIVKKLYPDGNYYLETTTPYYNVVTEEVEYATTKKFITALDLKECGCLECTDENLCKLQSCCPDVYNCYYAPCASQCNTTLGGYKVFEENGLLQLDYNFKHDHVYLEYRGYMRKVNGQYVIPEVAFETIVSGTKFKSVENKSSVPLWERQWYKDQYTKERQNMQKVMARVSLANIVSAVLRVPKFDIDFTSDCPTRCVSTSSASCTKIVSSTVKCETPKQYGATVVVNNNTGCCPFQIAVVCGSGEDDAPVVDSFDYQNDLLIDCVPPEVIIVNNNNESRIAGDFTFDPTTGTITRTNQWTDEDVLIIPFAKYEES